MQWTPETKRTLTRLALETVLYAALVVVYLFLILGLFTGLLVNLFKVDRLLFGGLALGLMAFQGIFLESVTTFLIDRLGL